jgi:hypothetical protein
VTRARACEHLADLMTEWFQTDSAGRPFTAESIAATLDAAEKDEATIGDSIMWYPVFAMTILERAGSFD